MAEPKRGVAYEFFIALIDSNNQESFKVNPTIATGDFQVSIDGGAYANLSVLPSVSPASSVSVKINLSAVEMDGDKITIKCIDAAGSEWTDVFVYIDAPSEGVVKGQALSNFSFLMVSSVNNVTPQTGLSITSTISKDGGAFASTTNSVSEISNGIYSIDLTAVEMASDIVVLIFAATGATQRTITLVTE